MTIEEYKDLISTATPENFQIVFSDVLENVQNDFATIENYEKQIEEKDTKIRDLQDTNQKLFLSQTKPEKMMDEKDEPDYSQYRGEAYFEVSGQGQEKVSLNDFLN
jgi:hypothetical protein